MDDKERTLAPPLPTYTSWEAFSWLFVHQARINAHGVSISVTQAVRESSATQSVVLGAGLVSVSKEMKSKIKKRCSQIFRGIWQNHFLPIESNHKNWGFIFNLEKLNGIEISESFYLWPEWDWIFFSGRAVTNTKPHLTWAWWQLNYYKLVFE